MMKKHNALSRIYTFILLLLCSTIVVAQPGGPGRPGGRFPGGPGGGPGQNRGKAPKEDQTQTIRQKKVVKDSTLLTVVGTLTDSVTGEALIYVNVGVFSQADSSLVRGTVTDDKGKFEAKNVYKGKYFLKITSIGYETKYYPFEVINNTALGTIKIKPGSTTLETFEVTAERPMFAMEGEKMIYNVSEDPSVQDGTTSDALQNAPGVEVDIEGNVTLRGTSSVEIWINDRPSKLTAENLKTYLETLPANALDHIEVISNPSAKYATESDAVINIITTAHIKKNHFISFGLNGSSTPTLRPWLSYMWANEKFSFNIYTSASNRHRESESYNISESSPWNSDSNSFVLTERDTTSGNSESNSFNGDVWLNFDYQIDSMRNLSGWGGVNFGNNKSDSYSDIVRDQTFGGNNAFHYFDTNSSKDGYAFGFGGLNYQRKFDNEGHNLRITADGGFNSNNSDIYRIRDYRESAIYTLGTDEDKYYKTKDAGAHFSVNARYNHPLNKNMDLSFGLGIEHARNHGTFDRFYADNTGKYSIIDTLRTYTYNDQKNSIDLDVNLERRWGAFTAEIGLGAEMSLISVDYENNYAKTPGTAYAQHSTYFNDKQDLNRLTYHPSLHLSYYTQDMHNFSLSYTLRMSNPEASQLTTFRNYGEDSYSTGNPNLKAQVRHQMEAGWSKYFTGFGFVGLDAYFNYAANEISNLTDVTTEADEFLLRTINYSMPYNMGSSYRYGLQLHSTFRPTGTFNLRFNANLYNYGYSMDRGAQGTLENSMWSYSMRLNGWYKFMENYQLFGMLSYRSKSIGLASVTKPDYHFDIGMRGDFFKKKMSAFIMVQDVFNWGYKYGRGSENTNPAYMSTSTSKDITSRYIVAGITFRFGKLELETRAKEGGNTDDSSTGTTTISAQ